MPDAVSLTLKPERLIRGRIINTEGRPVVGAAVAVLTTMASSSGSLDEFLTAWGRDWNLAPLKTDRRLHANLSPLVGTNSDADGRFEIHGIGAEQVAILQLAAPDIATTILWAVNRDGFEPQSYNEAAVERIPARFRRPGQVPLLVGPTFEHVIEPGLTVEATVFAGKERQPVAGALVTAGIGFEGGVLAETDDKGRFTLHGLPHGTDVWVRVRPSQPENDLLDRTVFVRGKPGELTTSLDIELASGVVVTGRVTDPLTGNAVAGAIQFVPLPGNPYVEKLAELQRRSQGTVTVVQDGQFRLVTMPGPGVLMVQAYGAERMRENGLSWTPYRQAAFSEEDRKHVTVVEREQDCFFMSAYNSMQLLTNQHAVKYLDLKPEGGHATVNLVLDRGRTVELDILDDRGKPLSGVSAAGVTESWPTTFHLTESRSTIYALGADRPRTVLLLHPERSLAGSLQLTGSEPSPVTVRLAPAGAIKGQAVDEDGTFLAGAAVELRSAGQTAEELYQFLKVDQQTVKTDNQGRFQLGNLVPGQLFFLGFQDGTDYYVAELTPGQREAPAGTTRDYGAVKVKKSQMRTASA